MDLTKTALGIELGSTRIKAVLINEKHIPVASGSYDWENQLVNGIWTYSMDEACRPRTRILSRISVSRSRPSAPSASAR